MSDGQNGKLVDLLGRIRSSHIEDAVSPLIQGRSASERRIAQLTLETETARRAREFWEQVAVYAIATCGGEITVPPEAFDIVSKLGLNDTPEGMRINIIRQTVDAVGGPTEERQPDPPKEQ